MAAPLFIQKEECRRTGQNEEVVRSSEFSWDMGLEEIKNKEKNIYERGLRLAGRAYLEKGQLYLPHISPEGQEQKIKLSKRFLRSVVRHVEVGFERNYIHALIFPDMGHSHFFIKKDFFNKIIAPMPTSRMNESYELILNHPETRFLYHTAEQLKLFDDDRQLIQDRELQWRFFTRNLVGDNQVLGRVELLHNSSHHYNTAMEYGKDFRYWGAGFMINGSKKGCFGYFRHGKVLYFDLSLTDLPI